MDPLNASRPVATGPFRVVAFDADAQSIGPTLLVAADTTRPGALVDAARAAVPRGARAFAAYDAAGARVGVAVVPPEPLTDDPDTTALALDEAAAQALTGSSTGDLRLWDLATGDPLWTHAAADEAIAGVAFVGARPWLLAWSDDGPLLLLERATGELITRIEDPQLGAFDLAIAPSGDEVALTGARVVRIALPSGELRPALDAAQADAAAADDLGVLYVAYLRDGTTLAGLRAGAAGDELVFWNRATGARVGALALEQGVVAVDASPDGGTIALGVSTEPATVVLVDAATRAVVRTVATDAAELHDVRFAPDGRTLFAHATGALLVIDPATGAVRARLAEGATADLVVPVEGRVLPDDAEEPGIIVTHDRQGLLELTPMTVRHRTGPVGRTSSRDGARVALVPRGTDNNYVAVFDAAEGRALATLAHHGNVQEIWISSDGSQLAVRAAGHVTVWQLPDAPASLA